jgi:hypothetical protein
MSTGTWHPALVLNAGYFYFFSNAINLFSVVNPENIKYRHNKLVRCYYVRHRFKSMSTSSRHPALALKTGYFYFISNAFNCFSVVNPERN